MIKKSSTDYQQRLETFIRHLEEARQLQYDWMTYGIDCVDFYVDDVDGDWLETWDKIDDEPSTVIGSLIALLESDDWVAVRVKKQLKNKSLTEIASELEKCLSLPEEEQIFAVKTMLDDSEESDQDLNLDLLDLAESLLEKLAEILKEES
jgi:hypothetical protein